MKMYVCKTFSFDAAHHLPFYAGKCRHLHGHHWVLEVEVSGSVVKVPSSSSSGMVVDFAEVKAFVNHEVIEILDHSLLNDLMENPTCENILEWLWPRLEPLGGLERLRLYETPDSYAEMVCG